MLKKFSLFICALVTFYSGLGFTHEDEAQEEAILSCRDCEILVCEETAPRAPTKW